MSHLGKLKPSHLYIYDRFNQTVSEQDNGGMEKAHTSTELTENYKIQLKDDGLGKYKISPLGNLKDPKEMVRIFTVFDSQTCPFGKKSNATFVMFRV